MFDKVAQAYIEIYDGITNEYLGRALFRLTPEVENAILKYANNEKGPDRIVIQDVDFYPASSNYALLLPFIKRSRKGIFKVMVRHGASKLWIPLEIYVRLNVSGESRFTGDEYHFDSTEYSDIVVISVRVMPYQILELSK